ncbi:transcriptional regulator [Bacillus glycinifermentans]|uniref:Transcriptional regulator n=1 Tax=Bacillus glycinifermentans TaxID=1664069 RepID=A0A0J6HE19_9BACI|nr:PadR family transcriptional regulator [Bacillus glycinifermentans]ATH94268.1 PadR family transcriptional regulator [Bacillus glycinifermentans]KMM63065.1 transcriptional regulator [Bacillus glycinifermentans]KRT95691.1 transcriptional regulator [Bacillus glycinifermentans]MEC0484423.1 PadR family transcriptional regulator [Bacillus glycinifermentans]MEC0496814.1 PadR family transcriptional regulator [Bacillus glycinifermentans]
MSRKNNTPYALLGLITAGYRTGYDMKQMIDRSLNHFWKISYGQIYPSLKHLTETGWVTAEASAQENKPDKKEYRITKEGQEALQTWLEEPIKEIAAEKNEFLLKIFFSKQQDRLSTAEKVREYQQKLKERYDAYRAIEQSIIACKDNSRDSEYWFFTLDYGKRSTRAGIEWCEATISRLTNREDLD